MTDTKPKPDDPAQSQRFIDMAREVEADESPEAAEDAIARIVKTKKVIPSDFHLHPCDEPPSS